MLETEEWIRRIRARVTIEVLDVAAGAGGEEAVGERQVEEGVGKVQRGLSPPVLRVDVGAAPQ